jgi:hypothetical protein
MFTQSSSASVECFMMAVSLSWSYFFPVIFSQIGISSFSCETMYFRSSSSIFPERR